jgi:putative iron-regulated protein
LFGLSCQQRAPVDPPRQLPAAAEAYATLAEAAYRRAWADAEQLEDRIAAFTRQPSAAGLAEARAAWVTARASFVRTEVFRYSGGPIDQVEARIDAWPIDESLIDYVQGDRTTGIVNDAAGVPTVTASTLATLNQREGETSVTTGYHAIEFLLWGQDLRADGPGARGFSDYLPAHNGIRRGTYLREVTALLVQDLGQVAQAWAADGPHRRHFLADKGALQTAWQGVVTFVGTELLGERLTVAYETKDQENETSCFSDNTTNDVVGALAGVDALVRATGLPEQVGRVDRALAEELVVSSAASLAAARAIPAPFDRAISGDDFAAGRRQVARTMAAIKAEADALDRARRLLTP